MARFFFAFLLVGSWCHAAVTAESGTSTTTLALWPLGQSRSPIPSEQGLVSQYSVSWLFAHPRQFMRRILWATILATAL